MILPGIFVAKTLQTTKYMYANLFFSSISQLWDEWAFSFCRGVVTATIRLRQLEINQCPAPFHVPNAFKNTATCDFQSTYVFVYFATFLPLRQHHRWPWRRGGVLGEKEGYPTCCPCSAANISSCRLYTTIGYIQLEVYKRHVQTCFYKNMFV